MDKLQLTGQNLSRVFNFRNGRLHVVHFLCYGVELPNSKLKTQFKQLIGLGYLQLDIALPVWACTIKHYRFIIYGSCSKSKCLSKSVDVIDNSKKHSLNKESVHYESRMFLVGCC